jgi:hypothetical protein
VKPFDALADRVVQNTVPPTPLKQASIGLGALAKMPASHEGGSAPHKVVLSVFTLDPTLGFPVDRVTRWQ